MLRDVAWADRVRKVDEDMKEVGLLREGESRPADPANREL